MSCRHRVYGPLGFEPSIQVFWYRGGCGIDSFVDNYICRNHPLGELGPACDDVVLVKYSASAWREKSGLGSVMNSCTIAVARFHMQSSMLRFCHSENKKLAIISCLGQRWPLLGKSKLGRRIGGCWFRLCARILILILAIHLISPFELSGHLLELTSNLRPSMSVAVSCSFPVAAGCSKMCKKTS